MIGKALILSQNATMPNPPSLDTWTIVFALSVFQAWFLTLIFLLKSDRERRGNLWLALLLFFFGLMMAENVMWWTRYINHFPHFCMLSLQVPFLFGPLMWFYQRWVFERYFPRGADYLYFLPFFIAILPFLPWYFTDAAGKLEAFSQKKGYPLASWVRSLLLYARLLYLGGFAILIIRYAYQQAKVDAHIQRWTRGLAWAFLGFAVFYASYFVLVRFSFFNLSWDYQISLAMTVFVFFIAYAGYTQPEVFDGLGWKNPVLAIKTQSSALPQSVMLTIERKLVEVMEKEALYQEAELSLEQLAQRLNVSKYHLSQTINEVIGCNFYEYINNLRVEKARDLLLSGAEPELSVKEIAYQAGFNNKVSFYNAFRKKFGLAPLLYKAAIKQKEASN